MRYDRIIIVIFILCSLSFPSQFKAHTQELTIKRVNHIGKSYLSYVEPKNVLKQYRMTSYWTNDGFGTSNTTGSGLKTSDFQVNSKGWYTYNNMLVIATATNELLATGRYKKDNRQYFNYYDELELTIDHIVYKAIVLDSCGASMWVNQERIDLFVKDKASSIDRGYKGINMIGGSLWKN